MSRSDKELSPQEEFFVQGLMKGETQYQAYLNAYPHRAKWTRNTIDSKASELAHKGKIKERLMELRKQTEEDCGINRTKVLQQLKHVGFGAVDLEKLRPADKLRALELIAKIMGYMEHDE